MLKFIFYYGYRNRNNQTIMYGGFNDDVIESPTGNNTLQNLYTFKYVAKFLWLLYSYCGREKPTRAYVGEYNWYYQDQELQRQRSFGHQGWEDPRVRGMMPCRLSRRSWLTRLFKNCPEEEGPKSCKCWYIYTKLHFATS